MAKKWKTVAKSANLLAKKNCIMLEGVRGEGKIAGEDAGEEAGEGAGEGAGDLPA